MTVVKFLAELEDSFTKFIESKGLKLENGLTFYLIYLWFFASIRKIYKNLNLIESLSFVDLEVQLGSANDESNLILFKFDFSGQMNFSAFPMVTIDKVRMIYGEDLVDEVKDRAHKEEILERPLGIIKFSLDEQLILHLMKMAAIETGIQFTDYNYMYFCFQSMISCILNATKKFMDKNNTDIIRIDTEYYTITKTNQYKEITMTVKVD